MVQYCVAYGCKELSRAGTPLSFHCFPSDENLKKKWILSLNRENFQPSKHSRLCSKHFTRDCFDMEAFGKGRKLKKGSVPSIFNFSQHLQKQKRKMKAPKERAGTSSHLCEPDTSMETGSARENCFAYVGDINEDLYLTPRKHNMDPLFIKCENEYNMDSLFIKCENEVVNIKQEPQDPLSLEYNLDVDTFGDELDVNSAPVALPGLKDEMNLVSVKCEYDIPECGDVKDELYLSCDIKDEINLVSVKCEFNIPDSGDAKEEQHTSCGSKKHLGVHHQGHHECDNTSFTHKSRLITHQLVHSGEHPYMCAICNKKFAGKSGLNRHRLIHSGQRTYTCDVCNKTFTRKSSLNTHQLVHNGQRPYVCDVCNKKFAFKHCLIRHRLIHSGQRPYICNVCNKTFTQKSSLDTHQLIHSGQHPYTCDICNKTFTQNSSLNTHQLVHSGQQLYMCDVCNKKFTFKRSLKRHRLIHSGQRPYICNVCNKTFTQKSNLDDHLMVHRGR